MTGIWHSMDKAGRRTAEAAFVALSTLDGMEGAASTRPSFGELWAFATGEAEMSDDLRRALDTDRRLAGDLDHLIERTALYRFPRVAAASSGAVETRDGEGFRIRLRPSRANVEHTYVSIEVAAELDEPPLALLAKGPGRWIKLPLPDAIDGVIQILVDSGSELVHALRDVHTEVYIR
ncbi:MAG: hypothetical protein HQL40_21530 [Alphaproteobacteria bacterium]|nr:hypothetical protein [Alphaproteobacteria bacterium]